jgi:hypothetical protein
MLKNSAGQSVGGQVTATDGSEFTGAVTIYITIGNGSQTVGSVSSGLCTHKGHGLHTYLPSTAETNGDYIAYTFVGTGAVTATVHMYPDATYDRIGANGAGLTDLLTASGFNTTTPLTAAGTRTALGLATADIDNQLGALQTDLDSLTLAGGEPGQGTPPTSATMQEKVDYIYKFMINKKTSTSDTVSVYNSAGTVVDHKTSVSDDNTTYTEPAYTTGP